MQDYNNYVLKHFKGVVESIFYNISEYTRGVDVSLVDVSFLDDKSQNYLDYIPAKETYSFGCKVTWMNNGTKVSTTIDIPKMMNNIFIVEGKYRLTVSHLISEKTARIYNRAIQFDYQRSVDLKNKILEIVTVDGETLKFNSELTQTYDENRDLLELDERDALRLKIKLGMNYTPTHIDLALVKLCESFGNEQKKDLMIDKRVLTVGENFIKHIKNDTAQIKRSLRGKLNTKKKIYLKDLEKSIKRFFSMQSELHKSIQVATGVNPLVFDSIKNKLVIPETVAYNESMADVIDFVNTPENNNVNKINEINKGVEFDEDGRIKIYCYDLKWNKVLVDYLTYSDSYVVRSQQIDYLNKKVKDDVNVSNVQFKHHFKNKVGDLSMAQFYEIEPDMRLSVTTRQLPLINYSDSVRVAMGASMSKQAIEIENSEPPLTTSGNEDEDADLNSLVMKSDISGTITTVSERIVEITDENGEKRTYSVPSSIKSLNDTTLTYSHDLKVGQTVEAGDAIIRPKLLEGASYNLGLNATTAFMIYRGYNNEDAVIVSETFAKRMKHHSIIDVEGILPSNSEVLEIAKAGTIVSSQEFLIKSTKPIKLTETTEGINSLIKSDIATSESNSITCPNSIEEAIVSDVQIILPLDQKGVSRLTETTEKVISEYQDGEFRNPKYTLDYPSNYINDRLEDDGHEEGRKIRFKVRLVVKSKLKVGDKITNRYGSKGVISLIEPDDMMPIGVNGEKIELILNPYSIISRKNTSQLIEVYLNKLALKLHQMIGGLKLDNGKDLRSQLERVDLYGTQFDKYSDEELFEKYLKEGHLFFQFKVGSFSSIGVGDVLETMERLNISEFDYLIDQRSGRKIRKPVLVGNMYMMKLYHLPEYSSKVTSSLNLSKTPAMGMGKYRSEGQKMGEMEMWALQSLGVSELVELQTSDEKAIDNYTFLNNLLMVGMTLKDESGTNIGARKGASEDMIKKLQNKYK